MVHSFQGRLAEMLAVEPIDNIFYRLKKKNQIFNKSRLYLGDVISAKQLHNNRKAKAADFHIIKFNKTKNDTVTILGVGEIKSYRPSMPQLKLQLNKHITRLKKGIYISDKFYKVEISDRLVRIIVIPETWKLSREFYFTGVNNNKVQTKLEKFPKSKNSISQSNKKNWLIKLAWSREALAQIAYEFTFWYLGKIGEKIFSDNLSSEWSNMSPFQASRNSAKMMLYYAILRCKTEQEQQRAIALYNTYGFGYSLGMNFKNPKRKREMLWFEDLQEIFKNGVNKYGSKIFR